MTIPAERAVRLAPSTWCEISDVASHARLVIPVGSTEQHGPHLPLDTDARIATALADALADSRGDVVVAPVVAFGASGEHAAFPGTLSIGHEALAGLLIELGRSADAFAGVVFVNGHGGNAATLTRVVAALRAEGRDALGWSWSLPGADAHAGRTETSLLLSLAPEDVHLDRAVPGRTEPVAELMAALREVGVRSVSPTGVLGDPTGASADEGRRLFQMLVDELCHDVRQWVEGPAEIR